jgi:hypothetical protein
VLIFFFDQIPSFPHSLLCMIVDANFASPILLGFMTSLALSIRIMFRQRGGGEDDAIASCGFTTNNPHFCGLPTSTLSCPQKPYP